ncbi:alpha/beta hydrolase [Tateyamaria omphalii]|uniref:alpha/beta hydrolase n=1 Tax=Tateyamaria omphalii TaxID=299262 RepID=UPI0035714B5D
MARAVSPHFKRSDACVYMDAPQRCPLVEGKRQWFSISRRRDYLSQAVKSAATAVAVKIERQSNAGVPVCLVGHSQGGMIASYLCLTRPSLVKTAICISSEMPFLSELATGQPLPRAQLAFLHGRDDPFICAEQLAGQVAAARERNIQITLNVFERGRHDIEDRYVQCAAAILSNQGSHQHERA